MSFFRRNRIFIDAASKVGGVCLLVFYVAQYSIDIVRTNQQNARAASISYIHRFADGEILESRMELLEFWNQRSDLAQLAVRGAISAEGLGYALLTELNNAPNTLMRLKRIGYFFDELYYCLGSELCNGEIVQQFFCPQAIGFEQTYFRFLRQNDAQIIGRDLYTGVKELSQICAAQNSSS